MDTEISSGQYLQCSMSTIIVINAFELRPPIYSWVLISGGLAGLTIAMSIPHAFFDVLRSKSGFAYACRMRILKTYRALFGLSLFGWIMIHSE